MSSLDRFVVAVLAHVTLITVVALILIRIASRRSAVRHAAGVVGLILAMSCPVLVLALPRPLWLPSETPTVTTSEPFVPQPARSIPEDIPMKSADPEMIHVAEDFATAPSAPVLQEPGPWQDHQVPSDREPAKLSPAKRAPVVDEPTIASRPVPFPLTSDETDSRPVEIANRPRASTLSMVFNAICVLWCLGMLAAALRDWHNRRGLRIVMRSSSSWVSERASGVSAEVCSVVGLSKLPPIRVSELAPLPFLLGVWKPIVIMPRELLESATAPRLRDVLIHECAHIVRRDPWVHLLQRLSAVIFWFHPGVHALNKQIGRAREELCDNFVLTSGNAAEYAETLFELSESCSGQRLGLSVLGLFSPRWTLEQRIGGLLDPGRETVTRTRRRTVAVLALGFGTLSLGIGGLGLLASNVTQQRQSANDTPVPGEKAPDQPAFDQPQAVKPGDLNPVALNPAAVGPLRIKPNAPIQAARKISIRGKCVDDDEKPIAKARVRVIEDKIRVSSVSGYGPDSVKVVAEQTTDDEGRFIFTDIPVDAPSFDPLKQRMLYLTGTAEGRASAITEIYTDGDLSELGGPDAPFVLSNHRLTVSGIVTDATGKPVADALVFMGTMFGNAFPGMWNCVTDRDGRYSIDDLEAWKQTVTEGTDSDGSKYTMTESNNAARYNAFIQVLHADNAIAREPTTAVPNQVNVALQPAAIVTGRVLDQVTGRPADSVMVTARGITNNTYAWTRTDGNGQYRFQLPQDHYNIWAEAADRIAAVLKMVSAVPGKTADNAEIRLVRGGFVVGTIIDDDTDKPLVGLVESPSYVAHYGPANLRDHFGVRYLGMPTSTIGAQQDTPVNADGTFRLRVAPGRNAVFFLEQLGDTEQSPQFVSIEDGQEKKVELRVKLSTRNVTLPEGIDREPTPIWTDDEIDADMNHFSELRRQAKFDEAEAAVKSGKVAKNPYGRIPSRDRRDSQVNRLLDQFEKLSTGETHFREPWLQAIKDIVDVGPAAVPELIEELDATDDLLMMQMLGFALRAINDRRSVPALIRAIPKTLPPVEPEKRVLRNLSDLEMYRHPATECMLTAKDPKLVAFVQGNALGFGDGEVGRYMYHGSVREICGALTMLTGARNGEEEIFHMERYEETPQSMMPAIQQQFEKVSQDWAAWWEQHQNDELVVTAPSPNEAAAIETIKKFGGHLNRDGAFPGRPITYVRLEEKERGTISKADYLTQLNALKGFSSLQTLHLLPNDSLPAGGMKIIGELHSLTAIHFGDTNFVGGSTLGKELKEIRGLTNLRILDLIACQITNEDLDEIALHRGLTKLRMSSRKIDDEGMKKLRGLHDLEELELTYTSITNAGLAELAELKNLKKLELRGTKVTDAGLKELKRLTNLRSLDMSQTKITGAGFSGLNELQNLRGLNLNNTRVTDAGAKAIAELTSLTSLKLDNTKITDKGLKEFVKLKNLRIMDVKETDVSKAGCAELENAVPHLQVYE